jgi:DNA polymerase IV
MDRDVLHINISAFPIGVERVIDSRLRERPVVIAAANSPRAVALAVSREAYLEGVLKGMAVDKARKFCRGLIVVPPNPLLYRRAETAVEKIVAAYTPLVEPGRPGHLHLDLTGSRRLLGQPLDAAARLSAEIKSRLRLRNTVGLASNKLVARVASRVIRPRGLVDVFPGGEADFLAPLELDVLPGVGDKTAAALADFNLRRVGELAALAPEHLFLAFGRQGLRLHQYALGIDPSPVRPPERAPALREEETLSDDSNDDRVVSATLLHLCERAGRRLRSMAAAARLIRLEIGYADHVSAARQVKLAAPEDQDRRLFAAAQTLLEQAWTRRIRLRYLTLTVKDLHQGPRQLELFSDPDDDAGARRRDQRLTAALDHVRTRFGESAVRWGKALTG